MLELDRISKTYNPGTVTESCLFSDFSLTVADGEFVSIVGSNGSGKTTMLNMICGTIPIDAGDIRIGGRSIRQTRDFRRMKHIGRVYQNPALGTCPNMTMLENLALADAKNKRYGLMPGVDRRRIDFYRSILSELGMGLEDKLHVKMGMLSGGQRQVVALLMATMNDLDFLILDEHTAALDPKTADTVMELTDRVVREKRLTAMMVTHNLRYACEYGSRLIMLDRGHIVMDRAGADKAATAVADVLHMFNEISIECGN